METKKIYKFIKILSVVGILLSVYLLWQQIARPSFQPCNINSIVNCNAVVIGPVAKTFGISTPLYGLVGYIVIALSAVLRKKKLMLGMTTFGLVFCLYIAYREIFQLNVICPVCILCQLVMISIFILTIVILRKPKPSHS